MNVRLAMCFLLSVCLAAASGCALYKTATAEPVLSPTVQVLSVRLADQSDQGARLIVTVELSNPNPHTALPLTNARYRVSAGGASAASSARPARTLPAAGTQRVDLPIALAGVGSLSGAAVQVSGEITYRPPGEVRQLLTESNVPLPTAGFSYSGTVQ